MEAGLAVYKEVQGSICGEEECVCAFTAHNDHCNISCPLLAHKRVGHRLRSVVTYRLTKKRNWAKPKYYGEKPNQ